MNRQSVLRPFLSLAFAAALLSSYSATARPHQDNPSGLWSGAMEAGGQTIEISVVLQSTTDGGWTGLIDIPAQNTSGYPLSEISVSGNLVSFTMAGVPGNPVFTGTWDPEDQTIAGNLAQGGQTFPFSLTRTADSPETTVDTVSPENAAKIAGTWSGTLAAGPQTLRIVFHVIAGADGGLTATMDSPDQGQSGLPVNTVAFDGNVLRLALDYVGATFEGTMTDDGATIDGSWSQGGASLPLRVTKQ